MSKTGSVPRIRCDMTFRQFSNVVKQKLSKGQMVGTFRICFTV